MAPRMKDIPRRRSASTPAMSLVLADTSVWDDVALLASVLLTPGALLWTADKILHAHAGRLDVAFVAARQ
jgi:hypothetical protein